eukprot:TRINITY_DN70893_c0_g1_i1.p2 TRINITY_DN70893_c0_g1~~TRINITY_DN70893_c0_g1_i1.p2  ORF type:complete len:288 (+),score=-0.29 TRINITY_DN70893_c0_g1_i1:87-866(+)
MEPESILQKDADEEKTERKNEIQRPGMEATKWIKELREISERESFTPASEIGKANVVVPATTPKKPIQRHMRKSSTQSRKRIATIKLDDGIDTDIHDYSVKNKTEKIEFHAHRYNNSLTLKLPLRSPVNYKSLSPCAAKQKLSGTFCYSFQRLIGDDNTLKAELHRVRISNATLRQTVSQLTREKSALMKQVEELKAEIEKTDKKRKAVFLLITNFRIPSIFPGKTKNLLKFLNNPKGLEKKQQVLIQLSTSTKLTEQK